MLAEAQPTAGVRFQVSTAEDLPMREQSVDIVTAFQAFHWFARDQAMHEFRRILKSPGRVALIWNNRETANPFDRAYADLVQSFGEEAAIIDRGTNVAPPRETLARHGFSAIEKREFAHGQQLNFDGLIGRAGSTSYLPQEGPEYERLLNALRTLHRQFGDARGFVRFSYRAVVYRGDTR